MNRKSSFWLRLFNIRIDETATVKNLVLHHFFLGIGIALLLTVAGTYFLSYYPPEYFPIAYMLSSLVMMLVGRMYSYFEHALSMRRLLKAVMLILVLLPVLLRLSFYVDGFPYLPLFIMIGFRIIYLLSNLEFWGLSSIVFDVRQGKRLFGLISSGDVPAKLLGYLSVAWLVPAIGLSNLLWIAAVSFALSLFFLRNILLQPDINLQVRHVHQEHFSDRKLLIGFFGNTYILWLSIMGFLTAACFTFIDFSFLYNVQQQYQTQEELASFLGIFFAVGYTFTMLIKVLFSGRLAEKTGIRFSLLVMPVLLFLFSVGFMFYGSHESTLYTNLLYIGIMSMAVGVAKYSINDPVYLAMFQPLPAHLRLKGHTVIKGFIQPLALGVTGIILWAIFEAHESFSFYLLNQGFILLSLTWIFSIFHSHKLYIKTLATAIRKRFISGSEIALEEKSFASLLRQGLHQGDKEDLVYVITALEQKAPEQLREEIPYLLGIEMTDVRKMVLSVLKKHPWHEFAGTVILFYKNPAWSELHADAAFYCARAAWPEIAEIFRKEDFRHLESPLRESILAGMLQSGKVEQEQLTLEKLKALFRSPDKDDLMLAIAICRREYRVTFREDLLRLLNHELEEVREAAIRCAGMSGDEAFIQHLIDGLLSRPDFSSVLSVSLSQYGDGIFRYLEKIPVHAILDKSWLLPDLIRIAERTSGEHGGRFLFSLMHHARPDLKEKMMDVLSASRYVLNGSEREKLEHLLKTEIGFAAALLDGQADKSITPLLREAFDFEYASCLKRVVSIAGLLYNRKIMREAAAAFRNNSKERTANALEVMEQVIPRKTAQVLVILLDKLPAEEKLHKLRSFAIVRKHEIPDSILRDGVDLYSEWTICLALRAAAYSDSNFIQAVNILRQEGPLLQEAAARYILSFKENNPVHFSTLAGTFKFNVDQVMKHPASNTISEFEKVMILKGTALFGGTPENIIAEITPIVREERIAAGDVIFSKGDSGSSMYIIYNGEIKIHDGDKTFAVLGKRDFFGELALLDPEPRSASATAVSDSLLLKLEEEEAYELMEERTEVLRSILRILCRRIRNQNEKMVAAATKNQ